MSIFVSREKHLIEAIDAFIRDANEDYFIPHMIKHTVSATFIPDRLSELITDFLTEERENFHKIAKSKYKKEQVKHDRANVMLDSSKYELKARCNQAIISNDDLKQQIQYIQKQISDKQDPNINTIGIYRSQINVIGAEIKTLRKSIINIRQSIGKMKTKVVTEDERIKNLVQNEKKELKTSKRNLKHIVHKAFPESQMFQKKKISTEEINQMNEYQSLKHHNENLAKSLQNIFGLLDCFTEPQTQTETKLIVQDYLMNIESQELSNQYNKLNVKFSNPVLSSSDFIKELNNYVNKQISMDEDDSNDITT